MKDKIGFKEKYNSLPQKKQRFAVNDVEVLIEVKPYPTSTVYGNGRLFMVAYVFFSGGIGVRGEAIFNPDDEAFDFRFGAELALKEALKTTISIPQIITHTYTWKTGDMNMGKMKIMTQKVIEYETRKAIWNEFNRLLPK